MLFKRRKTMSKGKWFLFLALIAFGMTLGLSGCEKQETAPVSTEKKEKKVKTAPPAATAPVKPAATAAAATPAATPATSTAPTTATR
jgi:hypothetical protein